MRFRLCSQSLFHSPPPYNPQRKPLHCFKLAHSFIHSGLNPSEMFTGYTNGAGSSDARYADSDDLYRDNGETIEDSDFEPVKRRTGKKQRWRSRRQDEEHHGEHPYNDYNPQTRWRDERRSPIDASNNWLNPRISLDRPAWAMRPSYQDNHRSDGFPLHDVRLNSSRLPSPPPLPIPTAPSEEYLRIASSSSTSDVSNSPRKLLILDLNGTLLVRASSRGAVHARPYMSAFRAFLFADATRRWLDVMIWSSAQPHNVDRMVRKCFFDGQNSQAFEDDAYTGDKWDGKLAAVWARDTLGLSSSDYCE